MINEAIRTHSEIVTCGYRIEYKGLSIPVSPMRKNHGFFNCIKSIESK